MRAPFQELSTHTITSSKEDFQRYEVIFFRIYNWSVSHAQTPSQFALRQHNHKQLLLVKRLHLFVWQTLWDICQGLLGLLQFGSKNKDFLEVSRHNRWEADLQLMHQKLMGRNVGQKLIMWSGKWSLYQDISQGLPQTDLHMLAQDL